MKYIGQLKESLIQSFNGKSLKFNLILWEFIIGGVLILTSGIISELVFKQNNAIISIFLGFMFSYVLFIDTVLHLFKNIKKLSAIKINLIMIKDLLIILFFFIISYKFIKLNFIFVAVGITITPVSMAILWLFFPLNIKA
ncbi:MAG: hypothetical protein M0016_06155 [Deltaproteobacteria bacterium]|jgi:hypothetical protein|nr:hypothetical protein [Deltaproteobacteria bacterium]MCL5880019.1 hypothetical protein [Deltaproteobacteria bacterium]MDA8304726.1 hypothetical protein [Deltaproteobacteria bacterium]